MYIALYYLSSLSLNLCRLDNPDVKISKGYNFRWVLSTSLIFLGPCLFVKAGDRPGAEANSVLYHITQNFRGRKHSPISRFWSHPQKFEIWACPCQTMIGFSIPREFSLRNVHFLPIRESFLPRKFPVVR